MLRSVLAFSFSLLIAACVSTQLVPAEDDPANTQAPTAGVPTLGQALASDFDPLAAEGTERRSDAATESHDHSHHGATASEGAPVGEDAASGAAPLGDATKYTCPMHPEIVRDEPGKCPICGMKLVPMKEKKEHKTAP